MAKYKYQTVQVTKGAPPQHGPSTRGKATGAAVELLHKSAVALNGWAVSWRVNKELEKLAPQIDEVMPDRGGVLVCAAIQEWATPDPTGTRAQSFLSIHIAGAGKNAASVYRKYEATPKYLQEAPEGWRRRDVFIWVTETPTRKPATAGRR